MHFEKFFKLFFAGMYLLINLHLVKKINSFGLAHFVPMVREI